MTELNDAYSAGYDDGYYWGQFHADVKRGNIPWAEEALHNVTETLTDMHQGGRSTEATRAIAWALLSARDKWEERQDGA